jgi:hypothetical protein
MTATITTRTTTQSARALDDAVVGSFLDRAAARPPAV